MKSSIGVIFAVLFIVSVASAGQFGPAEPMADPGRFSLGIGRWLDRSQMTIGNDTQTWKSSQAYVQGNYTFLKDWETYGRLGGASLRIDNDSGTDFRDRAQVFGTLGFKGVAYRYKNFAIGPFVEGSMYGDHTDSNYGVDVKVKNQWNVNLGISAQYKIPVYSCDVTVYGGPFAYWNRSTVDVTSNGLTVSQDGTEKNNIGAFLGVKFPIIKQKLFLTAEGQMRDKVGGGLGLNYTF